MRHVCKSSCAIPCDIIWEISPKDEFTILSFDEIGQPTVRMDGLNGEKVIMTPAPPDKLKESE